MSYRYQFDPLTKTLWAYTEAVVNTTAVLPPVVSDWPSHMQDRLYAAIEACGMRDNVKYEIFRIITDTNPDDGVPYVHVVLRGVVHVGRMQ